MTKPRIHYIVRHAELTENKKGEVYLQIFTNKAFVHDNPIIARKEAFAYYKRYNEDLNLGSREIPEEKILIYDPLNGAAKQDKSQIEQQLDNSHKDFPESLKQLYISNPFLAWHPLYRIWVKDNPDKAALHGISEDIWFIPTVVLVKDADITVEEDDFDKELVIHFTDDDNVVNDYGFYPVSELLLRLENEYAIYEQELYHMQDKVIEVPFWDDEVYYEGIEGEEIFKYHKILKTPFDWSKYSRPNWWGDPGFEAFLLAKVEEYESQQIPKSHMEKILKLLNNKELSEEVPKKKKSHAERIEGGEGKRVEFKPSLLYNFKTQKPGISIKAIIARAICSFLNTKGGYLYIGVNDDKIPQGLHEDFSLAPGGKDKKDFFLLEFDQMIEHFLSSVVVQYITSEFYTLEGKDIFVVKVKPSKRPVYLNDRDGKKFYVRGHASSRMLTDIEEIVNYCNTRWG